MAGTGSLTLDLATGLYKTPESVGDAFSFMAGGAGDFYTAQMLATATFAPQSMSVPIIEGIGRGAVVVGAGLTALEVGSRAAAGDLPGAITAGARGWLGYSGCALGC